MYSQLSIIRRVGMRRAPLTVLQLTLWTAALGLQGCATLGPDSHQAPDPSSRQIQASFLSVPLSFEANQGQTDAQVKFLSRGPGYGLFLTPTEAVLTLRKAEPTDTKQSELDTDRNPSESAVLRMRLVGANPAPEVSGETALPGKVNYFKGNDPSKWRTNVPTYAKARYENVYPGIDLVYYGNQRQLEYDFVVAPRRDPQLIRLQFQGMDTVRLDKGGNLQFGMGIGSLTLKAPVVYQKINGAHQSVKSHYLLQGRNQVGIAVASYDPNYPLVVDPVLTYSTYLGGSNNDVGNNLAIDSSGAMYLTGTTISTNFPTENPIQGFRGGVDLFVTKIAPDGATLEYSTYLGGSSSEAEPDIAVDTTGHAYVSGQTSSTNFPTTAGVVQSSLLGVNDAFVTKLNTTGSALAYSTYLGGPGGGVAGTDQAFGIAVDGAGHAYISGQTSSPLFPITIGALQPNLNGNGDAFVTKLNATGTALLYSTYLGGSNGEFGWDITVDSQGNAHVTGTTFSGDFPTSGGAFQTVYGGGSDAFLVKLNAAGSAALFSTYLGGIRAENGFAIALSSGENAFVTGETSSRDFPTTLGVVQPSCPPNNPSFCGGDVSFVTQFNQTGTALVYSTYLRSTGTRGIVVDSSGNAHVTGFTRGGLPLANPLQETLKGTQDAFVTKLNVTASRYIFSTYLGGTNIDGGRGIALDTLGSVYLSGSTRSTDFPTVNPLQETFGGVWDAFVAKIAPDPDFVVINGCETDVPNQLVDDQHTISDLIHQCAAGVRNHGQFVSCVAHLTNGLKKARMISGKDKGAIMSCAGQAAIP